MLSLYMHIPFCQSKCNYCAFSSFALAEKSDQVAQYLSALKEEIKHYSEHFHHEGIKTLYFWGGTPNLLGADQLSEITFTVEQYFDCSNLAELSFEFNPYPEEEIYAIIKALQKTFWKKYPRIRFSFGIQSFDNEVLQLAGRHTRFLGLVDFLRNLQPLKQDNTVFNFDFIAFGKWNQSKKGNPYLRTPSALQFFTDFVNSQFADSFSLYTLELFENQARKRKKSDSLISGAYFGTDEQIYEEFSLLKDILLTAWYHRYELSNFALAGKSSIHNRTYREMENYLGLGLNASSFLKKKELNSEFLSSLGLSTPEAGLRFKNTNNLENYCNKQFLDPSAFEPLSKKDYLIEEFFLGLRTDKGVPQLSKFTSLLIPHYEKKLQIYENEGLITIDWEKLKLTDAGMDVFNGIVTEIMNEI